MIIPVGASKRQQTLVLVDKKDGEITRTNKGGCAFVDLVGSHGW